MSSLTKQLENRLNYLQPIYLEIINDSEKHAGHVGAMDPNGTKGETHFRLIIASNQFTGKSKIERHRIMITAIGDDLHSKIHSISAKLFTPAEYKKL